MSSTEALPMPSTEILPMSSTTGECSEEAIEETKETVTTEMPTTVEIKPCSTCTLPSPVPAPLATEYADSTGDGCRQMDARCASKCLLKLFAKSSSGSFEIEDRDTSGIARLTCGDDAKWFIGSIKNIETLECRGRCSLRSPKKVYPTLKK
ncbi:unnamed protein product [Caenorhabditis brenneri]